METRLGKGSVSNPTMQKMCSFSALGQIKVSECLIVNETVALFIAHNEQEILEGFDIQRTTGFADTFRRYGYLSLSIKQYYSARFSAHDSTNHGICPIFNEFIKRCQDLEKMTVSDVFALQLMQVPLVTEEIAVAVIDLYPTLFSLARAYALLEGNVGNQQELLKNQIKTVSSGASKNIFKLVWGS